MNSEEIVALLIPLTWVVMLGIEALGTGRRWPAIHLWRTKGAAFLMMTMGLNAALPALLPPSIRAHHLFDGARLGAVPSVAIGFFALTLANALLHRAYHRFDILWRWVHQLHHSPHRLDIPGAALFTPWEVTLSIAMFQLVVVFLLGLDPLPAAVVGSIAAFYGLFQHFNIRTPRWLGYLVQRPESHGVHHRRGFHAYNYSDLPLWDILWGTFRNPKGFLGEVGFEGTDATRIAPMLVGWDANAAAYGPRNRGRSEPAGDPA
jgi:sterol desaturase/sphingolipid hydroxylase (fatty acid hydroxylase superfamily)